MGTKLRISSDFVGRQPRMADMQDERTKFLKEQREALAATFEERNERKEFRRSMFVLFGCSILVFTLLMYFFG